MIILEVSLNDEPLCRAGVGAHGAMTAMVTWFGPRNDAVERRPERLDLHVGGVATGSKERLRWFDGMLKPGDRVTITIAEGTDPEEPRKQLDDPNDVDPMNVVDMQFAKKTGAGG